MTEAEWLACADPKPMLEFLHGRASDRKLRLFALGCFRPYRFILVPESLEALEDAERLAEGTLSPLERKRARDRAFQAGWNPDESLRHRRGPAKSCVTASLGRNAHEAATRVSDLACHIGVLSQKNWPSDFLKMTEIGNEGCGLVGRETGAGKLTIRTPARNFRQPIQARFARPVPIENRSDYARPIDR